MANQVLQQAALALQQDWDLQLPDVISEEIILSKLTDRVVRLLERGPDEFFQLMYRLDISEKKLNGVMLHADVAASIARLIYDRQVQKIISRQVYGKTHTTDPDLQW